MPQITPPTTEDNELTRAAYVAFTLEAIIKKLDESAERQSKWEGRIEEKLNGMEKRINEIPEKYVSKQELKDRIEPLNKDIAGVSKDVESINANISKLVWIVLTAVIVALLGLVVMNPPQIGGV